MTADAAHYLHGHHESVMQSHRWRTAENSAAYLLPELHPGMSLLDVGCGAGTITVDLADRITPGKLTAVDNTEAALASARAEADARGRHDIEFVLADAGRMDFPDDHFDVVHAHQVLQHLANPVETLVEMRRVCRPGGLVAARDGDYAGFTWYPEVPELDEWLALYRRLARLAGGEPDAGRRLLHWARRAGLEAVESGASTWCYATPEGREHWAGTWARRVVDSDFARQAVDSGLADEADLQRLADGWRRWADHEDGWFGVLHGHVLARA